MQVDLWVAGPSLALAGHWQPLDTTPDDPPGTEVFGYQFDDGARGFVTSHVCSPEYVMPREHLVLIDGLLEAPAVRAGQAALIEVDGPTTASGVPYVYSLMKIKQEPSGVQYNLTLHLFGEHVHQVQGFFMEGHTTGLRDATVYALAQQHNALSGPTSDDPTGGWARDPYTGDRTGFVMNMSEMSDFDHEFPTHPLSMARELLRSVTGS